jgi:hypothetical protein
VVTLLTVGALVALATVLLTCTRHRFSSVSTSIRAPSEEDAVTSRVSLVGVGTDSQPQTLRSRRRILKLVRSAQVD